MVSLQYLGLNSSIRASTPLYYEIKIIEYVSILLYIKSQDLGIEANIIPELFEKKQNCVTPETLLHTYYVENPQQLQQTCQGLRLQCIYISETLLMIS